MFNFKAKRTIPIVIAVVLAVGLLAAASTGLLKNASQEPTPEMGVIGETADDAGEGMSGRNDSLSDKTGAANDLHSVGAVLDEARDEAEPTGKAAPDAVRTPERPADEGGTVVSPNETVTRAVLATMMADAFQLPPLGPAPFSDVQGHAAEQAIAATVAAGFMDAYPDGTFRPEKRVHRAELAMTVIRGLKLDELALHHQAEEPVFRDVPVQHEAHAYIDMAHKLGLFPFHFGNWFAPDDAIQQAEAQQMIRAAQALERKTGPVTYTNLPARTIGVEEAPRRTVSYVVDDDTLIVRNGNAVSADRLQPGDLLNVYARPDGQLLVAIASGSDPSTSPVVQEAVKVLRELATPEQLSAIIARDWDKAGAELKVSLYNQLLEAGLSAEEATALLDQDWPLVEKHGKERLTQLVSETASVDPQLVRAVLDQDWDTVIGHIEVEVLEFLLNYLMETAPA